MTPLLVIGLIYGTIAWRDRDKVVVDIGAYPDQPTEERAAIRRLSHELKQHPDMNEFIIRAGDKTPWRKGAVGYTRIIRKRKSDPESNIMWVDRRFYSPEINRATNSTISRTGIFSEEHIHNAEGSFVDILKYTRDYLEARGEL